MSYTIEPDGRGRFIAYEWGIYEESSVLAGQDKKSFRDDFATVAEALVVYPKAEVMDGKVSANNTFGHLPDREMSAYEEEHYWFPNDF